jgi:hypothetical protein
MSAKRSKKEKSVTFTALVWLCMFLMIFGAVVAVLGLGGSTFLQFAIQDTQIKTTNVGLAIMGIAALTITFFIAKHPKDVQLFGANDKSQVSLTEKIMDTAPTLWLSIGIVCIVLALVLFFIGR